MIKDIKDAFKQILPNLAWMDETTREKAIEKVSRSIFRIDYSESKYSELGFKNFTRADSLTKIP